MHYAEQSRVQPEERGLLALAPKLERLLEQLLPGPPCQSRS